MRRAFPYWLTRCYFHIVDLSALKKIALGLFLVNFFCIVKVQHGSTRVSVNIDFVTSILTPTSSSNQRIHRLANNTRLTEHYSTEEQSVSHCSIATIFAQAFQDACQRTRNVIIVIERPSLWNMFRKVLCNQLSAREIFGECFIHRLCSRLIWAKKSARTGQKWVMRKVETQWVSTATCAGRM